MIRFLEEGQDVLCAHLLKASMYVCVPDQSTCLVSVLVDVRKVT